MEVVIAEKDKIDIQELERRVSVFVDYCDYIREDCSDDFEEELYEFVNNILEDYVMINSNLRKKLNDLQNLQS